MDKKLTDLCANLIGDIDAVFPPVSSTSLHLTASQCTSVTELREDVRRHCESGDDEEARRAANLAIAIIRGGPPSE